MKTILITGGTGFLGQHVQDEFKKHNLENIKLLFPSSKECNLLYKNELEKYCIRERPNVILHMAAVCGGIGLNKKRPADLTHLNLKMLVNLFDLVREFDIDWFYGLGSVCSYPVNCPTPFKEDDMWQGYSESTNRGYGEVKRMIITEFQEHKKQYGLKGAVLVPINLFGQKDHFDLENSHVIPALIRKFYEAKVNNESEVHCWGTGGATREFLFSEDAAKAIVKAVLNNLDTELPINLGTGSDISIKDLAELIANLVEYKGKIVFTAKVSDGQPKRRLDVSRAKDMLGFTAETSLEEGLKKTIEWYKKNREIILK